VAGAGTGKTRTLAARVARLVDSGVAPERILLLTFTRRAAQEMVQRAGRMTSMTRAGRVWGGTFHAVGNRLLRVYGASLGLPPNFTVLDQGDGADLMNLIRNELELGRGRRRFPKKDTLASVYSRAVNARTKLVDVVEAHYPWCKEDVEDMARIFKAYTERKREQGTLDFDDLLLYWHALMRSDAGPKVAESFDHVLVDEYQDTNEVQAEILRALRKSNQNIMVVGDDAQSIYSFRAATIHNILNFPQHFPGTTVVKLEKNYRSSQPILDVSNAVIANARKRYEKDLFSERMEGLRPGLFTCRDEAQQSEAVCGAVLDARERGVALAQQAVLFRTGHHSAHLEIELTRRNIPFVKYGGLRFVEAAHVRDVLALLRILENPHDELAWFRVLQLTEGVGPSTASRIMESLGVRRAGADHSPERDPLRRLVENPPPLKNPARRQIADLAATMGDCLRQAAAPATEIERVRAWCEPIFERVYDNAPARLADLTQLEQIASGYGSRARFIADLALDPPVSTGELAGPPLLDEDYLILSTIHSAKGCEWEAVYVIHAADGMMPSDM
ncbi:MAG: ATP-dependent helicase, partial [Actinomycetota bacterium]